MESTSQNVMKPKILIGIPTMGSMHTFLAMTVLQWMAQAQLKGDINMSIYPTMAVCPVDNARNEIVEQFLQSDCTHLFFIDSDTIPPMDALYKLLSHDKDIVSGITPIIEHDANRKNESNGYYKKWNAVDMNDKFTEPNVGLIQIKGCGGSCVLIKRAVFEKMPKPWYRFLYKDDRGKDIFMGEDTHFIAKAIGLGFKAYADTSVIAQHNKSIIW